MTNYYALIKDAPLFDFEEWQTIIQNYVFKNNLLNKEDNFEVFRNTNTHAILGAHDPYLDAHDFGYWQELLGKDNVSIVENAGHYLHIEQSTKFLNFLES
jgi:pimeloyl-ACP methyl ester carboxylesterase